MHKFNEANVGLKYKVYDARKIGVVGYSPVTLEQTLAH